MTDKNNSQQQRNETPSFRARVFQKFYNTSMDGLWIVDMKGRFLDVNPAYCDLIGYSREELLSLSVPDIEGRETPEMVYRHIEDIIAAGKARFETVHRRKDGNMVEVEVSANYLDGEHGGLFLVFVRDLTERRQMEIQIQHRLAIEGAIAHASRLFISADEADLNQVLRILGEITAVNRAYIFRLRANDQKVAETYEWCDSATRPHIHKLKGQDAATFSLGLGNLKSGENIVIRDISTFPPDAGAEKTFTQVLDARSLLAVPIRSRAGELMGIMGFDNTEVERDWSGEDIQALRVVAEMVGAYWEHRQAEEEKEKMQSQLLRSQKMEAVGLLAGGVAHEFNNRLTTIQGYADLARKKVEKADPLLGDLNQISLAADRAADLTRQLLLFSRRQPTSLVPLNLNRTVDSLLKMLHSLIGEDITIAIDLAPNLWPVQMNEGNIEQVIMNLALNARDAMPRGGQITIKTENVILTENDVSTVTEGHPGQFVVLSVTDTGSGMSKEVMSQIFEPFFTTKEAGKGTGLGLPVVYGIIKQHRGWVNVYSEPEQGSLFRIYLPAFTGKPHYEPSIVKPQPESQGKGERILLVEDDEGVRGFTSQALSESGYTVFEAASTQDALIVFEQERGNFRLLLSDMVLPDQSGPELAARLLSLRSQLAVLLTSGYTEQRVQCPAIVGARCRFLQKPYTIVKLLQAVREIIGDFPAPAINPGN
ncbi:MAG: ATP-binding protein [bacterium]